MTSPSPTLSMTGRLDVPESLTAAMQLLAQLKSTVVLSITTPVGTGRVVLEGGQFRHASFGAATGEHALAQLLNARQGEFTTGDLPDPHPPVNLHGSYQEVLMRAAVTLDHLESGLGLLPAQAPEGALTSDTAARPMTSVTQPSNQPIFEDPPLTPPPAPDHVPQLSVNLNVSTEEFPGHVWRLLHLIDGRLTLTELSRLATLPVGDVQAILTSSRVAPHVQYTERLLPPTFWSDTQEAATDVLGMAAALLLRKAAKTLGVTQTHLPFRQAALLLDALVASTPADRQPQVVARLNVIRAQYAL